MPITGSQKALMYALSGVMRSGASRSGYVSPKVFVAVNGTHIATARAVDANKVLDGTLSVTEVLNDIPNTATFTTEGIEPTEGQDVVITLGSKNNADRVFAGTVLNRKHRYVGSPTNWQADLNAIDYTWQLTWRKVSGSYTNVSATTIANAIIAQAPAGFTSGVVAGLPVIDAFSFTDVTILQALTQLAKRIGGYCDVDYHKLIKLFITDSTVSNPVSLTSSHVSLTEFEATYDISQIRTRIYVEGGGANAIAQCGAGETIVPVDTAAWYNPAGGTFKSGSQHVTYSGVQTGGGGTLVGPGAAPSAAPALTLTSGSGVEDGSHDYSVTFVTGAGESLPGPHATTVCGTVAAPSSAPVAGAPGVGPGPDAGTHDYAVTFVNASGETTPSAASNVVTTVAGLSAPASGPTVVVGGVGHIPAGTYLYAVTFTNSVGETTVSPTTTKVTGGGPNFHTVTIPTGPSGTTGRGIYRTTNGGSTLLLVTLVNDNTTTSVNDDLTDVQLGVAAPSTNTTQRQTVIVSSIPIGGATVTQRKLYRTAAGGSQLKLLTTIANNTTTSYTDTTADASLGANVPVTNTASGNQVSLSGIPLGGATVTQRKVYRTVAGGSQLKLLTTIADNTTTTYADSTADASLGANAPTSDTSGLTQPSGIVLAGTSSIIVAGAGAFSAAGGWAIIGNGQQIIRYAGLSGSTLTGIPTSGIGAITASVTYNSTITAAAALTGVPASGAGAIAYTILPGDPINLLVQVDDTSAQAALVALMGSGDGIVHDFLQDGTIGETEARARGLAQLALRSTTIVSIRYKVRDPNTHAGRSITVSLGAPTNVTKTFQIQRVTVDAFQPALMPTYTVDASSDLFSLEDLLRMFRVGLTT